MKKITFLISIFTLLLSQPDTGGDGWLDDGGNITDGGFTDGGVTDGGLDWLPGCTDECADNYDAGNLFDDGSCEYTIPDVENLSAASGPARVILSWDAPEVCGQTYLMKYMI